MKSSAGHSKSATLPSAAPALAMGRRFWWIGVAGLGGAMLLTALVLATRHHAHPSPPATPPPVAVAESRPPVEDDDDDKDAPPPADLPDFEVDAVKVLEGEATWYRLKPNSLPLRRAWPGELTAASDRIAPNTYARVHRIDAKGDPDRSIVVRITDDGVHRRNTILDLNRRAAGALGMAKDGQARVRVEVLALRNVTTDKPVGKKSDPPLNRKASEITDQPVATRKQERQNARANLANENAP